MTDIAMLNSLKEDAVKVLLTETFVHIKAMIHERHVALGRLNSKLLNVPEVRFMHSGIVYPIHDTPTIPWGSRIPALHYSLLSELDAINQSMGQTDYHYIKNFFAAVVSQSQNSIVLDNVLPAVLVSALRQHFNTWQFKAIDSGVYGGLKQEPISITQQNIQDIKTHYHSTITLLHNLLMDKLLLHS